MKCLRPVKLGSTFVACGKCEACCANKTNDMIIRFLATARHNASYFITLTYEDNCLPFYGVNKEDVQIFLRKLKKNIGAFKYVLIAEYGGAFCRPHYHANMFTPNKIDNFMSILEECWNYGIVDLKDLNKKDTDVKALNYIAKYHSTACLSKDIYKIKGYPLYFRKDDTISMDECRRRLSDRFGISIPCIFSFDIIKCVEPFRLTSRGVGIELLEEDSFRQSIANQQFYTLNNNGRKSSIPRYYRDKFSLFDSVKSVECKMKYAENRPINDIDKLAIEWQDTEKAQNYMSEKWRKNYEENVIERKKKRQREL